MDNEELPQLKTRHTDLTQELNAEQAAKQLQAEKLDLLKSQEPNRLKRLFGKREWDDWSSRYATESKKLMESIETLQHLNEQLKEYTVAIELRVEQEKEQELRTLEVQLWRNWVCTEYQRLQAYLPDVPLPPTEISPTEPDQQLKHYYQNEALNRLRSDLFVAALRLHEAWLMEVAAPGGPFRSTLVAISRLLQGMLPSTSDDTVKIWQSLFMVIPVLSSTFASIGRLLRGLSEQSIGCMLIDEGGQALPQAAVGALWRAQTVLCIGDPLQIEPIAAVPSEIVDGMAKVDLNDEMLAWAPSQLSVQLIVDRISTLGTMLGDEHTKRWSALPLQVHRRCAEPMFSIANKIAYGEWMMPALSDQEPNRLPTSCWYDVKGVASIRQYVDAQGKHVLERLIQVLPLMAQPDVYIISPFREVVQQLKKLLICSQELQGLFEEHFPQLVLKEWLQASVGTVHAFQGKQSRVVFLVLGGDLSTLGALSWASSKPNLLNVAATRARHRFYIIGDRELWGRQPYFDVAAQLLASGSEGEKLHNSSELAMDIFNK